MVSTRDSPRGYDNIVTLPSLGLLGLGLVWKWAGLVSNWSGIGLRLVSDWSGSGISLELEWNWSVIGVRFVWD